MKNYRPGRAEHRARSHDSAHTAAVHHAAIPDHPLIPPSDPAIVRTQPELESLIAELREAKRFAYDSEFIGELTYVPKLCLIQVATAQRVWLIDPLEPIDLVPFWQLLCDATVEKIVHAGPQDLEPVFRHLNQAPANVFDTQIAAGFISLAYPISLSKLVREITGTNLGKGLTFTHWDHRPLSPSQLRYAADDVRYLLAVREELGKRLDALGHTRWVAEECATLCDPEQYQFDPDHQFRRIRGATSLSPTGLSILRELVIWRDATARTHDLPPRAFLKDEILLDLARNPVRSIEKLSRVKGLPRPVEAAHGSQIVQTVDRAASLPSDQLPSIQSREETPAEKFRADSIWVAVECLSLGRGIDPDLVASRAEITQLHRQITNSETPNGIRLLTGWRREAVGQTLLDIISGHGTATLAWKDHQLRTSTATFKI